jgi:Dolichyl-phosphate-mannose-protein mannosyltransferase
VAIDVGVPRSGTVRLPLGLERLAAIPAWVALAGIVAASFLVRLVAALGHATPLYFPDEYIYSTIARSLAEHGRPVIRGASAHFPAMLEPLLAAPFWLPGDPGLAYRLTQAENALAMSLAAVPIYLLVRRLGLGAGWALAGAALTVASPDLFFSSFLLADPIAYTLALAAIYAGVRTLSAPTRRAQLAFLAFAGLATFARVQYVVLPVAFLVAALVVERGVRPVLSRYRFTLALLAMPLVGSLAFGPSRLLGYYSGVADLGVRPAAIAHWVGTDGMLLAYSAGWVIVPGALIGLWLALARPRTQVERAFGALTVAYAGALFAEAALYASNGSSRFQERYLMTLLPLAFPAFCLYIKRGATARRAVAGIALVLIALSARVPLSGYTIGDGKQDSPFLLAVFRLEKAVGIDTGSLAVAVVVAGLSLLAIAVAYRVRLAPTAVAAALLFVGASSAGAVAFDHHVAASVRRDYLPADARWIDHAGLGSTLLIQTPTTPHARAHEELFWNTSLKDVLFLDGATGIDAFGSKVVRLRGDGAMTVVGTPIHKPFAISNHGVRARFRGAVRIARGNDYELWRPLSTPRMTMFVGGLYHDSWLAQSGNVKVFPAPGGRVRGTLRFVAWLPAGTEPTRVVFRAPGVERAIVIRPLERRVLTFRADSRGPWKLRWLTKRPGYLGDGRPISVMAQEPSFVGLFCGTPTAAV